jgi:hypothetical protein
LWYSTCLLRGLFAGYLIVAGALTTSVARGEPSADAARAEAMFAEGRRLMSAGDYAAACPKFADSQSLDPAPGTALNLAICYEKAGKLASAWAAFKTAQASAGSAGQRDRAAVAKKKSAGLEARVSRLTIAVPAASQAPGLEIRCDQEPVREAEWGVAVPRDGGGHDVQASAPGKMPWTTHVELKESGQRAEVEVPRLEDAPSAPVGVVAQGGAPPVASEAPPTAPTAALTGAPGETPEHHGQAQRVVGLAIGGLGVAGVALGSVAGLLASSKYNDAKIKCGPSAPVCGPGTADAANSLHDTAVSWATVSTTAFIAGGVALAAGVVLFVTAPKDDTGRVVGIGPASQGTGLSVAGTF